MKVRRGDAGGDCARKAARAGFTLIELLVVVSLVALLLSILLPSLSRARSQGRSAVCGSSLRQVVLSVMFYAQENNGSACPGAADFFSNLHRWHGERDHVSERFDPSRGPLAGYLGDDGAVKRCPSFRGFFRDSASAFERGNGGYGYNNAYIGMTLRALGGGFYSVESDRSGVRVDRIRRPAETVMFADAAFVNGGLIEYSFAEPPLFPTTGTGASPSLHFRHERRCQVGWCDGHVDRRRFAFSAISPWYVGDPARHQVGWFGRSRDNTYFDLN